MELLLIAHQDLKTEGNKLLAAAGEEEHLEV